MFIEFDEQFRSGFWFFPAHERRAPSWIVCFFTALCAVKWCRINRTDGLVHSSNFIRIKSVEELFDALWPRPDVYNQQSHIIQRHSMARRCQRSRKKIIFVVCFFASFLWVRLKTGKSVMWWLTALRTRQRRWPFPWAHLVTTSRRRQEKDRRKKIQSPPQLDKKKEHNFVVGRSLTIHSHWRLFLLAKFDVFLFFVVVVGCDEIIVDFVVVVISVFRQFSY